MTFGERILYSSIGVATFFGVEAILQIVNPISAQEIITVKGTPIELPEDALVRGRTWYVDNDCLHEHPEDAKEACLEDLKYVLRIGGTLGSVIQSSGEIILVKGDIRKFDFIKEAFIEIES